MAWFDQLSEPPASCEIVRVEFLRGLRSAQRRDAERFCDLFDWVPVTEQVARLAGELGLR
ncbi:MAG: hypothetical protein ACRDLR_09975, partial [Gaiellaceae bacterium]